MWLEKRFEHEPERSNRWDEVGEALEAVELRRHVIGSLACDVLVGTLEAWLKGEDEAAVRYFEEASAREVIEAVELSAKALRQEARHRMEQREAILELAKELGAFGVKLLLGALLAV